MTIGKFALLLVTLPLIASCSDKPQQDSAAAKTATAQHQAAPATPSSTATARQGASPSDANNPKDAATPPTPHEVLEAIYQADAHGRDSMAIANGSQATYWYGHAFDLNGKHYYTGFVYSTAEKRSQEQQNTPPAPDTKVTLADATFQWIADGTKPGWNRIESERYAGQFGSYEKADQVDPKEAVHSAPTASGGLLLAVPTWYLDEGMRIKTFSMLFYDPSPASNREDSAWTFVGSIPRGEDNSAACGAQGGGDKDPIPCVAGSGQIAFGSSGGAGLPDLHVTLTGSGFDEVGDKQTYGPGDVLAYRFNPKSKTYEAEDQAGQAQR
jgi:hypothetical protein